MQGREFGPFSTTDEVDARFALYDEATSQGMTPTQLTESKLDDLDQAVCKMIRAGNFLALDVLVKATRTDREFVLSWASYTSLFPTDVSYRVHRDMGRPSIEEAQTFKIDYGRMLKIIERALEPNTAQKNVQIG